MHGCEWLWQLAAGGFCGDLRCLDVQGQILFRSLPGQRWACISVSMEILAAAKECHTGHVAHAFQFATVQITILIRPRRLCNQNVSPLQLTHVSYTVKCSALVAASLRGVSSAVGTCSPADFRVGHCEPSPSCWSSTRSWSLRLQCSSVLAPAQLPAPAPVLHLSAPGRRGAVADARLGLA